MLSLGFYKPDVYCVSLCHYILREGRHLHAAGGSNITLSLEKWRELISWLPMIEADI
jgi:hypothetical protein